MHHKERERLEREREREKDRERDRERERQQQNLDVPHIKQEIEDVSKIIYIVATLSII